MDANAINQLISTVGFPIVSCIALAYFIYKAFEKITNSNSSREERLYDIIGKGQAELVKMQEINEGFVKVLETYSKDYQELKLDVEEIKKKVMED